MSELTRQQICAALAVSESTIRRLELDGLPCTPVGRSKRYDLAECKAWLRSNRCQSGRTSADVGMLACKSMAGAFTEYSRRVHRRVMPSGQRLKSVNQLGDAA